MTRPAAYCLVGAVLAHSFTVFAGGDVGLVLAGGGAKGAYEIGVWKAICERKLDREITAISGSSVGAINAALFGAVKDPEKCERLWRQSVGGAFACNTNTVRRSLQSLVDDMDRSVAQASGKDGEVSGKQLAAAAATALLKALSRESKTVCDATGGAGLVDGICDSRRLRGSLSDGLPPGRFPSFPAVYATAVNKMTSARTEFRLNGLDRAQVVDRLLASAAVPVAFDTATVDGVPYVDGGCEAMGGDNVPVTPVVRNHPGVRTLIVVYLRSEGKDLRRISAKNFPGVRIIEIIPSTDIGGFIRMFDVSGRRTDGLIDLGYRDAVKALARWS